MAKQRFRDIKKGKIVKTGIEEKNAIAIYPYAKAFAKIKAFVTDSFMLMMPIMYIVMYLIMDGREGFQSNMLLGWVYIFVPLIIAQSLFMIKTAQTPGYRAYNLMLIDEQTGEKPTAFIVLFRNFSAVLSFFTLFGWVMMFFRKDAKTLHDLLTRTAVIHKI